MARVLGIDLSGRTTGRTALALALGERGDLPRIELVRSQGTEPLRVRPALRRIAALADDLGVDLVAVDAPLTFPHPWTCDDDACERCFPADGDDATYTLPPAEHGDDWEAATGRSERPMPTAMLGALAARGVYLRRAIERRGISTLETWPAGVLRQLGDDVSVKPSSSKAADDYVVWAQALLEPYIETDWKVVNGPDDVDALAAAFAGWIHATGAGCLHVGEDDDVICVPGQASARRRAARS